jgi:transcriptional regulator with XRE-family HTH domain
MMGNSDPRRRRETKPAKYPELASFAKALKDTRHLRGLTQREVARRADISVNHLQDIEGAQTNPTAIVVLRLIEVLAATLRELFPKDPAPPVEDLSSVSVADLTELADAHRQFTNAVERLTRFHV